MLFDIIEKVGVDTLIQHGKHNDRIYLMKFSEKDGAGIIDKINKLAIDNKYSKIFCKIPKWIAPSFFSNGFILEACIPEFYKKAEDVFFVSKFLNSDRILEIENSQLEQLSKLLKPGDQQTNRKKGTSVYEFRQLNKKDIKGIVDIYKEVFRSYPFPIHNPEYILHTMKEHVQYYGAFGKGKLVAVSSSEIDLENQNAEMTDFATTSKHLGKNLSNMLLGYMEQEMKKQNITTLYTIARLNSIPMNKTFLRNKYSYAGTLIKNTNISGQIESMNVYYKHI